MKNAIIICSGGLDSVVTAHYAKKKLNYDNLIILFFNYNQKPLLSERDCAVKCSKELKAKFIEIKLPELAKLSSSLINIKGKSKKLSIKDLKDTKEQSRKFYVPFRNGLFTSYALALADSLFIKEKKSFNIFLGFKCEGNNPFPDTTLEFVNEMNKIAKSTESKPEIKAPLINKDKEDIVNLAVKLGVNIKDTHSCYINNKHCGVCLACTLRKAGFYWANQKDRTKYFQ